MLTNEIRNTIDAMWTTLWTEGSTNPLTNIEQITYLIFMKDLDQIELRNEEEANLLDVEYQSVFPEDKPEYRWHVFKNIGNATEMYELMQNEIFPFIKNLHGDNGKTSFSRYMRDAIFQISKPSTLQRVVAVVDGLPLNDKDLKGDIYEYLLSKLQQSGTNGQFRTPSHIREMMVELMKPTSEDVIGDPAMGTAGFLVSASDYIRKNESDLFFDTEKSEHYHNTMFWGYDTDQTMLRIGAMNMMLHQVDNPQISYLDSLSEENNERDKYTLILANPPFTGSLDNESVSKDLIANIKTKKTELLFLQLFIEMLKPGGRAAVIVPDGVLFGSSNAHKALRKQLIEEHKLEAVISMPSGVFKPYAGVSTAVLIFTKTGIGGTDNIWFYEMEADGYSLNDGRNPIEDNDIPDIIERYHNMDKELERNRTEKSFVVPKEEIVKMDYELTINKYNEIIYEKIEYDEPETIIQGIVQKENKILSDINELYNLIGDIDAKS